MKTSPIFSKQPHQNQQEPCVASQLGSKTLAANTPKSPRAWWGSPRGEHPKSHRPHDYLLPWQDISKLRRPGGLWPQGSYLIKFHLQSISHTTFSVIPERTFPCQSVRTRWSQADWSHVIPRPNGRSEVKLSDGKKKKISLKSEQNFAGDTHVLFQIPNSILPELQIRVFAYCLS